jgi:hypothetical protein
MVLEAMKKLSELLVLNSLIKECQANFALNLKAGGYLGTRKIDIHDAVNYGVGVFDPTIKMVGTAIQCIPELKKVLIPNMYFSLVFPMTTFFGRYYGIQLKSLAQPRTILTYDYKPYSNYYGNIFGLPVAMPAIWDSKEVVLVEGPIDAMAVSHIRKDVVASLTANIMPQTVAMLKRFANVVHIAFDNDDGGRDGTRKVVDLVVKSGLSVNVIDYSGKDPAAALVANESKFKDAFVRCPTKFL